MTLKGFYYSTHLSFFQSNQTQHEGSWQALISNGGRDIHVSITMSFIEVREIPHVNVFLRLSLDH